MVKFNFELPAMEAENLLDILASEVREQRSEAMLTEDHKIASWCRAHASYIEERIIKPLKEGIVEEKTDET